MQRISGFFIVVSLMLAAGCLTQARRNEIFSDGIKDAFIETRMAAQYLAYVAADASLSMAEKGKRTDAVSRVRVLLDEHGDDVVEKVKYHMITNGICDRYDGYLDADPALQERSKAIRKQSSEQIRKLIRTAEGS